MVAQRAEDVHGPVTERSAMTDRIRGREDERGTTGRATAAYARAMELDPANAAVMSRLQVLQAATIEPPAAEQAAP